LLLCLLPAGHAWPRCRCCADAAVAGTNLLDMLTWHLPKVAAFAAGGYLGRTCGKACRW